FAVRTNKLTRSTRRIARPCSAGPATKWASAPLVLHSDIRQLPRPSPRWPGLLSFKPGNTMRAAIAITAFTLLLSPALAQETTPNGMWQDSFGTILDLSLCGDGTQLCGVLVDVQGESRTEDNLAFVGQEIMQADQTAANEWQGAVMFD